MALIRTTHWSPGRGIGTRTISVIVAAVGLTGLKGVSGVFAIVRGASDSCSIGHRWSSAGLGSLVELGRLDGLPHPKHPQKDL